MPIDLQGACVTRAYWNVTLWYVA